jgi:WD40 repeat protein
MKNNELIVAGEGKARRFNTTGGKLKNLGDLDIKGGASSVKFSPDGSLLAAGDLQDKALRLFDVEAGYKLKVSNFPHSTKVMTMAWSPDGKYLASGCLDQAVAVWNTTVGKRKAVVKHAHRLSHVNSLTWLDENKLVSAGHDGHLKIWEASF